MQSIRLLTEVSQVRPLYFPPPPVRTGGQEVQVIFGERRQGVVAPVIPGRGAQYDGSVNSDE